MIIREYKPEDKEELEKCIFELDKEEYDRHPDYWVDPVISTSPYADYMLRLVNQGNGKVFVAEENNQVIGIIAVYINEDDSPAVIKRKHVYVPDFVVLKEFRGKGIGEKLISAVEDFAKDQGINWVYLDVSLDNKAIDFYKKHGYDQKSLRLDKKLN